MKDFGESIFLKAFPQLRVEQCPIDRLRPYARNPRTHTDKQIHQIAASIREFGFTNPILADQDGQIIAGHGRAAAAKVLGLAAVPVIRLEARAEARLRDRRQQIGTQRRLGSRDSRH